jgi:hypothetical protein
MPDIEYNKQPTVLIAMSYPQLKSGSNEYADNVVPIIMTDTSLQFAEKMQYTTNKAKAITYGQSPIYIQVNGVIRGTQNERCKTYDNIVSSLGKLKNNLMIRVGNIIMNSYVTGMQVRETSEAQNYDLISISAVGSYYAK